MRNTDSTRRPDNMLRWTMLGLAAWVVTVLGLACYILATSGTWWQ